jgi:hypothetical protein
MTLTGTLIEDLMATVERAEQRAQSGGALVVQPMFAEQTFAAPSLVEPVLVEPWFASVPENADYDSRFVGVA